ncbi:MAG: fumarate hydratase [Christensenellales bacterium]|nr:fumarate hydratase [Clostridiales bacterium]MDY2596888.1 fumarate hydratase [Eubacteriales bacterium]MDY4621736.1 fumarate hydratase [Eubacteriales bacterium]
MRTIHASLLTDTIASLCVEANCRLPEDMRRSIENARNEEKWDTARGILDKIIENYNIADEKFVPICQDTGVCCVFLKIGTDVHIEGDLIEAVNEGVRRGYRDGYLRKSVVGDPLRRVNTGDNTPAMLYTELVPGDKLELTVAPKGFGSENMSKLAMLKPSDGVEGVKDFVLKTVEEAGPNPCPPIVVGVGIGGTFDKAALLAKKALMRSTDERNKDEYYAALEAELLDRINALGIGPQGFGGRTTALAVNIETMPTHIAGLPVAVNINCHVTRHRTVIL